MDETSKGVTDRPSVLNDDPSFRTVQESTRKLTLTENEKDIIFRVFQNIIEHKGEILSERLSHSIVADPPADAEIRSSQSKEDVHKLTPEENEYIFSVVKNILLLKKSSIGKSSKSSVVSEQDNLSIEETDYARRVIKIMLEQLNTEHPLESRKSKSIIRNKYSQDYKKQTPYEQSKSAVRIQDQLSFRSPDPNLSQRCYDNDTNKGNKKPCFTFEHLKRYKQIDLLNSCARDCIEHKLQQHLMTQESRYPFLRTDSRGYRDHSVPRGGRKSDFQQTRNQKCQTNETSVRRCESFTRRESGVQVKLDTVEGNCMPVNQTQLDPIDKWCNSKIYFENTIKNCLKEEITSHLASLNKRGSPDTAPPTVCLNFPSNMAVDNQIKTRELSTPESSSCSKELIQLCLEILTKSRHQVDNDTSQTIQNPSKNPAAFRSQTISCEHLDNDCDKDEAVFAFLPYNADHCFKPRSSQKYQKYCQGYQQLPDAKPTNATCQNFKSKVMHPSGDKVDREAQTLKCQENGDEKVICCRSPMFNREEAKTNTKINWPTKEEFCQDFTNAQRKVQTENAQKLVFAGNIKSEPECKFWSRCPKNTEYCHMNQPYVPTNQKRCSMIAQPANNCQQLEDDPPQQLVTNINVLPCCTYMPCWSY